MASYEWSKAHQAFTKECITCDELFIGTDTQQESELIFSRNFGVGGASNLDGFHTSCNLCRNGKIHGYTITHVDKKKLYESQNGECPLCTKHLEYDKARVDHCHETGQIRGLLHTQCNSQLGFYESNKEHIIKYLAVK